jgi:hypothetical protein
MTKQIQDFVFYYPIHIVATTLKEAKEELDLDFQVDSRMVTLEDITDGFVKFLKTAKASKEDKRYYNEKQAEYKEMGY